MGAIAPSKMPKGKKITRKDNPNSVTEYAEGGKVSAVSKVKKAKPCACKD